MVKSEAIYPYMTKIDGYRQSLYGIISYKSYDKSILSTLL